MHVRPRRSQRAQEERQQANGGIEGVEEAEGFWWQVMAVAPEKRPFEAIQFDPEGPLGTLGLGWARRAAGRGLSSVLWQGRGPWLKCKAEISPWSPVGTRSAGKNFVSLFGCCLSFASGRERRGFCFYSLPAYVLCPPVDMQGLMRDIICLRLFTRSNSKVLFMFYDAGTRVCYSRKEILLL